MDMADSQKARKRRISADIKAGVAAAALGASLVVGTPTAEAKPAEKAVSRVEQFAHNLPQGKTEKKVVTANAQEHRKVEAPKQVRAPEQRRNVHTVVVHVEAPRFDQRRGIVVERPPRPFIIHRGWGGPQDREAFFGNFFVGLELGGAVQNAIMSDIANLELAAARSGSTVYCSQTPVGTQVVIERGNMVEETVTYVAQPDGRVMITTARVVDGRMVMGRAFLSVFGGNSIYTAIDVTW